MTLAGLYPSSVTNLLKGKPFDDDGKPVIKGKTKQRST